MTLRLAVISDAPSIAALSIEVWVGTYLKRGISPFFANYALVEFTTSKTEALISDPSNFMLVSENEDGIDGFIRVKKPSASPIAGCSTTEIATFYVQPRHHGKGIGKRLLKAACEHAVTMGEDSVWLTTNAKNTPAIAFYAKAGFEHVGETHFRIQDQAYLNNVYSYQLR